MADDLLVTHRDVVWSLPESVRMDFLVMADEVWHHQRVVEELLTEPGALWRIPVSNG